jgi:hypothetical protein
MIEILTTESVDYNSFSRHNQSLDPSSSRPPLHHLLNSPQVQQILYDYPIAPMFDTPASSLWNFHSLQDSLTTTLRMIVDLSITAPAIISDENL